MLIASIATLAQAVKAGRDAFHHPALDIVGKPAPDRASSHAGKNVHDHRYGDAMAARPAHELPHSLACSAGRGFGVCAAGGSVRTGRPGMLSRWIAGRICGNWDADTAGAPGHAR